MLLNDNEYSLKTISEKTNITLENLEKIKEKDWAHFKKPQLNGLLSIIEREFNVDLSDLKAEANAYFKEHHNKEPECPIDMVDAATVGGGGNRFLSNLITVISLCAVGYAGWYYFVESKKQNIVDTNITTYEKDNGMFKDTINSAKHILGTTSDSNKTKSKDNSQNQQKPKQETISQDSKDVVGDSNKELATKETAKIESKKFDITTINQDKESSTKKENESNTVIKQDSNANNANVEANNTVNKDSEAKSEADKLLKELDTNSSSVENNEDNTTTDVSSESNSSVANITKATINLKSKRLWLGIYDLTTHKRITKTIKKPFTLNIGEDKFAIVTGHNRFEIATNNGVKTFAKKGKVYFTIDKDGIKQLDRREYRKVTKRRAW